MISISERDVFPAKLTDNPSVWPFAETVTAPPPKEVKVTGFEAFPTVPPAERLIFCPEVITLLLVFVKMEPVVAMLTAPAGAEAWTTVRSPVFVELIEPDGKL